MPQPNVQQVLQQALGHHRAGRFHDAISLYEHVLAVEADNADALHLLGLANHQSGNSDEGVALIERAIRLRPGAAEFHANLAGVFAARGRPADAVRAIRRAFALRAGDENLRKRLWQYLRQLGSQWIDQDRPADAVTALEEAAALRPDAADVLANLGLALARLKRNEEAVGRYERALALGADIPELHTNLGAALLALGRAEDAAAAHRRAVALRPGWHAAKTNLAIALAHLERTDEALALHEEVLHDHPDDANALFNRGLIRLSRGDFAGGWRDYEARTRVPELKGQASFPQPRWGGEDPAGRTILVHGEQGLGDTIQFVRYVPQLLARGAAVVLQCDPLLARLLRHSFPAAAVVARGEPLPAFDAHVPVMSLPHAFHTTLDTVPRTAPYLATPVDAIDGMNEPARRADGPLRVGLVWAGNAEHYNDRNRSVQVGKLLPPVADVRGVRLFSLQKGAAADQLARAEHRGCVADLAPAFQDMADTAAAVGRLDLVICVDTGVAHLAGALGATVWTLLARPADFRWMIDREDSPWYPTMRLFRQSRPGDWDGVVQRVASELRQVVDGRRGLHGP